MPSHRKLLRFALVVALLGVPLTRAEAQPLSDNWNTAACGLTDIASIQVGGPVNVRRVEFWYNWQRNETSVDYTVFFNGQQIGTSTLVRGQCDPYQNAWCVAQDSLEVQLSVGTYTFQTARPRLCQNAGSGGQGFLRLYGD